ncbi:hypothetical protein CDAR_247661 [Caerostris darwini]|uniref:Uncharacterized protein n=1 Tax=Caerostris darwini TaxID=1538125 RepID=A0AAV4T7H6_9ARAC|nr:hypothetical protein CDAR_247661 [Caerostris darwini]
MILPVAKKVVDFRPNSMLPLKEMFLLFEGSICTTLKSSFTLSRRSFKDGVSSLSRDVKGKSQEIPPTTRLSVDLKYHLYVQPIFGTLSALPVPLIQLTDGMMSASQVPLSESSAVIITTRGTAALFAVRIYNELPNLHMGVCTLFLMSKVFAT